MSAVRRRARRAAGALMDEHLQETEDFTAQLAAASAARTGIEARGAGGR